MSSDLCAAWERARADVTGTEETPKELSGEQKTAPSEMPALQEQVKETKQRGSDSGSEAAGTRRCSKESWQPREGLRGGGTAGISAAPGRLKGRLRILDT